MGLLTGKTAIVTGAARGIGKAIALKFAAEGANIAFTDLVIDENGQNTEKEIAAYGVKVKGYASNAASFEDTAKVVEQIHKDFGSVDILVNNAGGPVSYAPLRHSVMERTHSVRPGFPVLSVYGRYLHLTFLFGNLTSNLPRKWSKRLFGVRSLSF